MTRFVKQTYNVTRDDGSKVLNEIDYVIKDTCRKVNHREIFRTRNETFADAILFLFDLYFKDLNDE